MPWKHHCLYWIKIFVLPFKQLVNKQVDTDQVSPPGLSDLQRAFHWSLPLGLHWILHFFSKMSCSVPEPPFYMDNANTDRKGLGFLHCWLLFTILEGQNLGTPVCKGLFRYQASFFFQTTKADDVPPALGSSPPSWSHEILLLLSITHPERECFASGLILQPENVQFIGST
jgi:hypothetical protein